MIPRILKKLIIERLPSGKAIILFGARQVGKTTLINDILEDRSDVLRLNGDTANVRLLLENMSVLRWRQLLGSNKVLFIDEAQRIPEVGLKLKLVTDELPNITIFVSGSSSFDLAKTVNEPLTGRKWEFCLSPFSFQELALHYGLLAEREALPQRLIYGSYPEIVTHPEAARERLMELSSSYLYQDVLNWGIVKKPEELEKLLQALAFQVGSQVSYNELAQLCAINRKTVERYVQILEQAFIIFRLPSYSKNLRHELKFSRKIYFYDNGIRNALLGDFSPVQLRSDIGKLWENYLVSERRKNILNTAGFARSYFWRTQQQQEIDYLEEEDGRLSAFEFKWNPRAKSRSHRSFRNAYGLDEVPVITPENYDRFLFNAEM